MRDPLPRAHRGAQLSGAAASLLIVGVGNPLRGDDAAGLEVARLLADLGEERGVAVRGWEGEGVGLIELWTGARAVWIVDAVVGNGPAGTVHRFDAGSRPVPATLRTTTTHATSVAGAVELARTLHRLPPLVVVYGIEGASFRTGEGPGRAVKAAAAVVADAVRAEVRQAVLGS